MSTGAGISLATMKANILFQAGIDVSDLANTQDTSGEDVLLLCINKSWWEVADKFDFREKEGFTDISLASGTGTYSIADELSPIVFDALRSVAIQSPNDGQFTNLAEISINRYNDLYSSNTTLRGTPEHFVRDGGSIIFWPIPEQTYTVRLWHLQVLADIPSGGPIVPQSWHELIEMGGLYRVLFQVRDYNQAERVRNHQVQLIQTTSTNQEKEDRYNKLAGVSVPTRPTGRRY